MSHLYLITRPFAVAIGIFTLLNLVFALENPMLATTDIWLDLHLPEPLPSAFAAVLGFALLLPHGVGESPRVRCILCGVVCGFAVLVATNAASFYRGMREGEYWSDFPVPLSVFIFLVLLVEFSRLWWWTPRASRVPPPARIFLGAGSVFVAFLLVTLTHVVSFGNTDYRRPADAAVIFGAKVSTDGTPSAALRERLDIGIRLFHDRYVDYLIMTGGTDANGTAEPQAMADYAIDREVPAQQILLDLDGVNTIASARGCRRIADLRGLESLLAVTQYFHCARVKLLFERQGLRCHTVPTSSSLNYPEGSDGDGPITLARERFFVLREVFAFPYYFLFHGTG